MAHPRRDRPVAAAGWRSRSPKARWCAISKRRQEVLGALRDAGVRIALDDFGTGYSSLYHLRNFKLDKIKIDRSFIDTMARSAESAAIVRALVGLGAGLGLAVTAEGMEDARAGGLLAEQGCDQGQGFLFSKAVPAAETAAFFAGDRIRRGERPGRLAPLLRRLDVGGLADLVPFLDLGPHEPAKSAG